MMLHANYQPINKIEIAQLTLETQSHMQIY